MWNNLNSLFWGKKKKKVVKNSVQNPREGNNCEGCRSFACFVWVFRQLYWKSSWLCCSPGLPSTAGEQPQVTLLGLGSRWWNTSFQAVLVALFIFLLFMFLVTEIVYIRKEGSIEKKVRSRITGKTGPYVVWIIFSPTQLFSELHPLMFLNITSAGWFPVCVWHISLSLHFWAHFFTNDEIVFPLSE